MKHAHQITKTPRAAASDDTYDMFQQLLIALTKGMAAKFF